MKVTLVITTYERPDALHAVLASVAAQSRQPHEMIVADDGSGPATAAVVRDWAGRLATPLRHCWQERRGFRLTRLRNLAILAASGDYLIFIDGDMLLHREFIEDHVLLARAGCYTQGVRILANNALTAQLIAHPEQTVQPWHAGLGVLRRLYLLHNRRLALLLRTLGNRFIAIKGCNQAFWRGDLQRVNGFEEMMEGWGPEDKELCARLQHAGLQRQSLLAGGIAIHLQHPPAARTRHVQNLNLLARTLTSKRTRSERGLDQHASSL